MLFGPRKCFSLFVWGTVVQSGLLILVKLSNFSI